MSRVCADGRGFRAATRSESASGAGAIAARFQLHPLRNRFLVTLALAMTAALAAPAQAHEPWIRPQPFYLSEPGWISFDISNSHQLFVPEENPLHDLYHIELVGPDGEVADPAPSFMSGRLRIAGEAELAKAGTHLLAEYSLRPIYDTRLRGGEVIGVAKDEAPAGKAVRTDAFTSSVKAFVTVQAPSAKVLEPRGYPVELVPLADPTALRINAAFPFQTLVGGKPAGGAECLANPEGTGPAHTAKGDDEPTVTADAEGKASLTFKKPGVWLVLCRHEVETRNDPKADYATYRAYLVLEVKE